MMESEKPIADSADSAPPVATFCVDNTPGTAGKTFFFLQLITFFLYKICLSGGDTL